MAICLGMMTLSMHYCSFFDRLLVRMELDALYSLYAMLQQRALLHNREQCLYFDDKTNSYRYDNVIRTCGRGVCFGVQKGVLGPPSSPAHEIRDAIMFDKHVCIFYPDGKIQSGSIYLTNAARDVSYALTCPVAAVSYVRMYAYDQGWLLLS
ncbi:MAG: hypothetical protein WC707_03495 [Candidatus Babeliaceae bacterium]